MTFPAFRSTPARLPDEWTAATPSFCPSGHSLLWLVRPPERDCYHTSVFGCVKSPDAPGLILMAGVHHRPIQINDKRYRVTLSALYPLITVDVYSWLDHPITPFILASFQMPSRLTKGTPNR